MDVLVWNLSYTLKHIYRIVTRNPSRLAWDMDLQGRYQSKNILSTSIEFTGTNNQEGPTAFYTSTRFTLWYSVYTHYINTYFQLYTYYIALDPGDSYEFNGTGGIIKPQGIGTIVLDLEDDIVKIHNINF